MITSFFIQACVSRDNRSSGDMMEFLFEKVVRTTSHSIENLQCMSGKSMRLDFYLGQFLVLVWPQIGILFTPVVTASTRTLRM